ncbi:MAG: T9SS type A sorting domain-containing protein, partial [Bacteroidales bacterium]
IEVYPNPVTDNLQIQTTLPIKEIAIIDITGRMLYTTTSKTINCSNFVRGVYFIKATTEKGVAMKKFIKE